jgi:hypothetical protein
MVGNVALEKILKQQELRNSRTQECSNSRMQERGPRRETIGSSRVLEFLSS